MNSVVRVADLVPGQVRPLLRVDVEEMSKDRFWNEHVLQHRPVVVARGARSWPVFTENLTFRDFIGRFPPEKDQPCIYFSRTFNCSPPPPRPPVGRPEERTFVELLREIADEHPGTVLALPAKPVVPAWKELLGDLRVPFADRDRLRPPKRYEETRCFIYQNASTEWHIHDVDETLTTQVFGTKKVSMFRLDRTNWYPAGYAVAHNLHHLEAAPQFFDGTLVKHDGLLEPGDVLYIPPFWWHGIDPGDAHAGFTVASCFATPFRLRGGLREPGLRHVYSSVFSDVPDERAEWKDRLKLLATMATNSLLDAAAASKEIVARKLRR
jgi:hypothetical protein